MVDVDKSGSIEYSEYLSAAINKEKAFSEINLKSAFSHFDTDKSGKISAAELRKAIALGCSEDAIKEFMKEFDENKDGEISFEEFCKMMNKMKI
jgi:calcium-dependent protein kinase